jgi:hypothetical protein
MAYSGANLSLVSKGPIAGAGKVWNYTSTDAAATVAGASYFSDGVKRGMKVGDVVHVTDSDTGPTLTIHTVASVSGDAATLGAAI